MFSAQYARFCKAAAIRCMRGGKHAEGAGRLVRVQELAESFQ
jgi:hypothetical protein